MFFTGIIDLILFHIYTSFGGVKTSNVLIFVIFVRTDMTFDDDTKLFGLMTRYSDVEEADELKRQVIQYVRTQIHDVNTEI